ncbi:MAG: hypothetical protein WCR78_10760 [Arcobacteraceae bacterium]
MQYGMLPKIDQFSDNSALEVKKIQPSNKSPEITTDDAIKQVEQETISKKKEVSETKRVEDKVATPNKFEVVLSNTNFGYNSSSKDFFVKVERGNIENQYPTQEMMRTKAYLMSLNPEA